MEEKKRNINRCAGTESDGADGGPVPQPQPDGFHRRVQLRGDDLRHGDLVPDRLGDQLHMRRRRRPCGAVVNLAVAEVFMAAVQSVYLWRKFHALFFFSAVFWICSSVVLGCWLLLELENSGSSTIRGVAPESTSTLWVKRSLGWFLFLVACLRIYLEFCRKRRVIPEP